MLDIDCSWMDTRAHPRSAHGLVMVAVYDVLLSESFDECLEVTLLLVRWGEGHKVFIDLFFRYLVSQCSKVSITTSILVRSGRDFLPTIWVEVGEVRSVDFAGRLSHHLYFIYNSLNFLNNPHKIQKHFLLLLESLKECWLFVKWRIKK